MQDLQEVTQDLHYENFRSDRLKRGGRLSSHGYILPLSPAYVPVCQLAFQHLPHLKQQTSDGNIERLKTPSTRMLNIVAWLIHESHMTEHIISI